MEAAMYTAVRLRDYEDILDPVDVHSLIALIAYLPVPAKPFPHIPVPTYIPAYLFPLNPFPLNPFSLRFDGTVLDRNYPFRGQKHEIYEGGVRVAAFVHSPLLPAAVRGTTQHALIHVTDWLPTIIAATGAALSSRDHLPLDGFNAWPCITGRGPCERTEVVVNINTVCDPPGSSGPSFATECPAPKAAIRIGDLKLLAECYDTATATLTGAVALYNLTADPSEQLDLSGARPADVARLAARLLGFAHEAAQIPPLSDSAPWQGPGCVALAGTLAVSTIAVAWPCPHVRLRAPGQAVR